MKSIQAIAALAVICVTTGAQAATVTYTGTYSGVTDVTNQVINVAQFDSSLGTLTSVTFELSATMSTQLSVTGDNSFYVGWDKLQYDVSLQGDTGYAGVAISASDGPTRLVGTGTADGSFTLAETLNVTGSNPNIFVQAGNTLNPDGTFVESPLAAYIGNGNLSFFLTTVNLDAIYAAGLQTAGSPSPAPVVVSTDVLGEVKVTYEYAAVPVPAAVWLFGSALGMLGWLRRKAAA